MGNDGFENATERMVAIGNQDALSKAMHGDPVGALADLDTIRDQALAVEDDPFAINEYECRRLETRLSIAGVAGDWDLFADCLQEVGKSERFSKERLSCIVSTAGGSMKLMLKGSRP